MRVLAADPYVDAAEFERRGVTRVSLDELLAAADVVTLHCNLTDDARGMINASFLAKMKRSALV